jgi:hypothetical protein
MRFAVGLTGTLLVTGCVTAPERFGSVARYAPDYGGYVVGDTKTPALLVDPITSAKLRCAEDVTRSLGALTDSLEAVAHDANMHQTSQIVLFPLKAASATALHVGLGLFLPTMLLIKPLLAPTRRDLYVQARRAYAENRYQDARDAFRIIAYASNDEDPYYPFPRAYRDLSLYYLGVCDDLLNEDKEAAQALSRFVAMGTFRDQAVYVDAEARLSRLAPNVVPTCRSRADVRIPWKVPS